MPKVTFYPNILVRSKFCNRVSLTTEENEAQHLTWCPLEETEEGFQVIPPSTALPGWLCSGPHIAVSHVLVSSCKLPTPIPSQLQGSFKLLNLF